MQFGNGMQGARTPTGQIEHPRRLPQGHRQRRHGQRRPALPAARSPSGVKSVINPSPAPAQPTPPPPLTPGQRAAAHAHDRPRRVARGLSELRARLRRHRQGDRHLDVVRRRARRLPHRGRRERRGTRGQRPDRAQSDRSHSSRGQSVHSAAGRLVRACALPVRRLGESRYRQLRPGQVLAQVWQNLQAAFAFCISSSPRTWSRAKIVEIIQQTPGVIAMQLSALNLAGQPPPGSLPAMLCASGPLPPQGAQMLLLDPATQGNIGVWS